MRQPIPHLALSGMSQSNRPQTIAESFRKMGELPLMVLLGTVSVFSVGFMNLLDVQVGKREVGLDAQVLLKLAFSTLLGLYGLCGVYLLPNVRKVLFAYPALWMLVIVGFYFLSVPFAISPTFALASAIVLSMVLVGTITAVVHLGMLHTLNTLFFALAAYNIGSWLVYFFVPAIGVFLEPTSEGRFVTRMGGLAHPNTLGQFSGLTVLLGATLYTQYGYRSWFRKLIIVSAAAALYMSFSRNSLAAVVLALVVAYRHLFLKKQYVVLLLPLATLGAAVLAVLFAATDFTGWIESKLVLITKSGDASELTTATGRADIWAYALRLIGESPVFGYGAASSKTLLEDYSMYTHNLWLNVALSTGVMGGLAALAMCVTRAFLMLRKKHPVADGLVAFIILNGLFENVIFSLLAGLPTMIWIVALTWWQYEEMDPAVQFRLQAENDD